MKGGTRTVEQYTRVSPTPEEVIAYRESHGGHTPSVYRYRCDECGKRVWGSGLGIGSHTRACRKARWEARCLVDTAVVQSSTPPTKGGQHG